MNGLHAIHRVPVVQGQRTHGGVVIGLDVGVAGFACRVAINDSNVVKCQGVLLVLVGLNSPLVCHGSVGRWHPTTGPNLPQTHKATTPRRAVRERKVCMVCMGFARVPSKLPSPTAGEMGRLGWFSTRFRADFALQMPRSSHKMGRPSPHDSHHRNDILGRPMAPQRNSVRRLMRRPSSEWCWWFWAAIRRGLGWSFGRRRPRSSSRRPSPPRRAIDSSAKLSWASPMSSV